MSTPNVTVTKSESDRFESWSTDSEVTEHMAPDVVALKETISPQHLEMLLKLPIIISPDRRVG